MKLRKILFEASQQIVTTLDQEKVAQAVLETVLKLMPSVEVVIFCYEMDIGEQLQVAAITGSGDMANATDIVDERLIAEVLQNKQTIYVPNWTKNSTFSPKSLIIEPLVLADTSLGALGVISYQPDAFDDNHQEVLTMLANQASIALQNARLYAEARRVDELKALHETGKAINQSLDLQETLTTTMTISRGLTGASVSNIYLYGLDNGGYRIDSVVTLSGTTPLTDADRHQSADIAWNVLKDNHPTLITTDPKINITEQTNPHTIEHGWPFR